jgi:hypothetical protein
MHRIQGNAEKTSVGKYNGKDSTFFHIYCLSLPPDPHQGNIK